MKQTQRKLYRILIMIAVSILLGVAASFVLNLVDFRRSEEILIKSRTPTTAPVDTLTPTQSNTPTLTPGAATPRAPTVTSTSTPTLTRAPQATSGSAACCTHCGPAKKPCGNGCIAKNQTCRKPTGCACR